MSEQTTRPVSTRVRVHGLVACLLGVALGCQPKEPSSPENSWVTYFNLTQSTEIQLGIETSGAYSVSQSGDPGRAKGGNLSQAEVASVSAVMTPERFEIYHADAIANCSPTAEIPKIEQVLWREQIGNTLHYEHGCWDRTRVQHRETIEMLDLLAALATEKLE